MPSGDVCRAPCRIGGYLGGVKIGEGTADHNTVFLLSQPSLREAAGIAAWRALRHPYQGRLNIVAGERPSTRGGIGSLRPGQNLSA